jgi:uncharacterized protein (TIGR02996 family)
MGDEERALVRAVLEEPGDDLPRLVFADWLEEHGQAERAEFCRVQCELAAVERRLVELLDDDTDWDRCEGVSARWCPNCGDCTCRNPEDSLNDADCPLHSINSDHCCKEWAERKRDALRTRAREMFQAHGAGWFGRSACITPPNNREEQYGEWRVVHRGFVESVRCTLATLLGEPCGRCDGLGECSVEDFDGRICHRGECTACSGTGRVGGCGVELFGSQPVLDVTVVGAEPEHEDTPPGWVRADDELGDHSRPDALPPELYDLLTGGKAQWDSVHWMKYPTRDAAMSALSTAVVGLCRTLAGLPPLTPATSGLTRTRSPGPSAPCAGRRCRPRRPRPPPASRGGT